LALGITRLDHDRSAHDDQAVVIGLGCYLLLGKTGACLFRDFKVTDKTRSASEIAIPRSDEVRGHSQKGRRFWRDMRRVLVTKGRAKRLRESALVYDDRALVLGDRSHRGTQ